MQFTPFVAVLLGALAFAPALAAPIAAPAALRTYTANLTSKI